MIRRPWLAATLVGLAVSSPLAARADEDAADLFRRGLEAASHREYAVAARAFEAAQKKSPHPVTAFNAGLAWQASGDKARAAEDFELALSTGLGDPQAADAKKRLSALEAALGRLVLRGPSGTTVVFDGNEHALPARVYASPGDVAFEVHFPDGRTVTHHVVARANVESRVDLEPDAPPAPALAPISTPVPEPESESTAEGPPRWLGWALVGGGAALVGTGVVVGVLGMGARDDFVSGGSRDLSLHDKAVSLRTWSNVLWIAGAVTGAVGVVLVVRPLFSKSQTAALQIGPAAITMRAAF